MSDFFTSNSMIMLERAANFQWVKQRTILNNISNAETPNYKTRYVTFEEALRAGVRNAAQAGAPAGSMRSVLRTAIPVVHDAEDESARMDENGVNVAEQSKIGRARRERFRAVHGAGAQRLSDSACLPGDQQ